MIGYFIKAGDEAVSQMFSPYVWGKNGFGVLFENKFSKKGYGSDLRVLLIKYYVEGKFDINGPEESQLSNYLKKRKEISVAMTVRPEMFHHKNEFERRKFIVESTIHAVELVKKKLSGHKFFIDFDQLLKDITSTGHDFLRTQDIN